VIKRTEKSSYTDYTQSIPKEMLDSAKRELDKIDTFEFNVFEVDKLFQKRSLFHVLNEIFNKYKFISDLLVEEKYINFVNEIIDGYNRDIQYHNDLHATDVLQTTHLILLKSNLAKVYNNIISKNRK